MSYSADLHQITGSSPMKTTDPAQQTAGAFTTMGESRPHFESQPRGRGRVGTLQLVRDGRQLRPVHTPVLYPVLNLITGTTPNGGGIWGYICNDLLDFSRHGYQL